MQEIKAQTKHKNQILRAANNYMNKKNISDDLRYNIRQYIEYYFNYSMEEQTNNEQQIFKILSEPLKRQLMIQSNKLALSDSTILSDNFSKNVRIK